MRTLWKSLPGKIFLAGAVIVGVAPSMASADFKVTLAETGFATKTFDFDTGLEASSGSGTVLYSTAAGVKKISLVSYTFGDFTIDFSTGRSNTPGTAVSAFVSQGQTQIHNTSSSSKTLTITVTSGGGAFEEGFTTPTSPPPTRLLTTASGTVQTGTTVTGTFKSWADATDAEFGHATPTPVININTTGVSYSQTDSTTSFSPAGKTYSLTDEAIYTLTGLGSTDAAGQTDVLPTPAPTGFVLSLSALPLFGLGVWLRRRSKLQIA